MSKLTEKEFKEVTKAFVNRLSNEMSNAGCNDLFDDEFPQSVCDKFNSDLELLDVWNSMIISKKIHKEDNRG